MYSLKVIKIEQMKVMVQTKSIHLSSHDL